MKSQHEVEKALALLLNTCYFLDKGEPQLTKADKRRIALLNCQIDLLHWVLKKDSCFDSFIANLHTELKGQLL